MCFANNSDNGDAGTDMVVQVWNANTILKDDLLASVDLTLDKGESRLDEWLNLDAGGKVLLSCYYGGPPSHSPNGNEELPHRRKGPKENMPGCLLM